MEGERGRERGLWITGVRKEWGGELWSVGFGGIWGELWKRVNGSVLVLEIVNRIYERDFVLNLKHRYNI